MIYNEKTIMDIMGISQDELIYSNILNFYMNPKEEHGLDYIVLKSLIEILDTKKLLNKNEFNYSNISLVREYETLKGNSIDIVIKNDHFVIGIENKVNAHLKNDLIDYRKTLEALGLKTILIVLSKNEINTMYQETGFINISYLEFATSLEKKIKTCKIKNSKWYIFLEDFIVNLKDNNVEYNYKKNLSINKEIDINNFIKQKDIEIENKIKQFSEIVEYQKNDRKVIHYNHVKVVDLTAYVGFKNYNIDARLTANGWTIAIYVYTNKKVLPMKDFLHDNNYHIISENNQHLIIKEFDYNENVEVIAEYYLNIYNLLKLNFI